MFNSLVGDLIQHVNGLAKEFHEVEIVDLFGFFWRELHYVFYIS